MQLMCYSRAVAGLAWCIWSFLPAGAQPAANCRDTPEGRICSVQQEIVGGIPVSQQQQQDLGLVTVGGGCSGTLVNRFWVLTADHCVAQPDALNNFGTMIGGRLVGRLPDQTLANLTITATWSPRQIRPTRIVRNWREAGLDVALLFLGGDNFGNALVQLFRVGQIDDGQPVIKFGRGMSAYAVNGNPPTMATNTGQSRTARFIVSDSSTNNYTLASNEANQVGNGGDSGGPDRAVAPSNIDLGIVGVQSTCVATGQLTPPPLDWRWVTGIAGCDSVAIEPARFEILQVIQERPVRIQPMLYQTTGS